MSGGVLVRHADGRVLHLWPAEDGYTPRLAHDAQTGLYAVVTWGRQGVRLATFTAADLVAVAPAPVPAWDAIGTTVDCGRFFNITGSTVPREASDGQCWQAHESGHEIYIVKGADPRYVEILRLTDDDVRLAYDATDSRYPRAWRLDVIADGRSDAHWCPLIGTVGVLAVFFSARLIRRTEDGPSTSEPFPYAVAVEAHGRHIDYGGDVGVVDAVLVTRFEPHVGKTDDGYHELHHWAIVSGRAIGLVRYEEVRYGAVVSDRTFTFNHNAPLRSVPLSSLIVHPIPDATPDVVPVPEPEPDPMPTLLPQHFALQNLTTGMYVAVEPSGVVVVDRPLAGIYETLTRHDGKHGGFALRAHTGLFLRATDPGPGADLAIAATEASVSTYESFYVVRISDDTVALLTFHGGVWQSVDGRLVGRVAPLDRHAWRVVPMSAPPVVVPPSVPTPEPGGPVTPSPRRGQLREDGRAFMDDGGDVLPFYIHQGDAISLFARDRVRAEKNLDEAVALGADGIRPWTVLAGLPFWQGRTHPSSVAFLIEFVEACKARGLRLVLSQGDLWQFGAVAAAAYIARLAEVIRACGAEWFDFIDAGNETWHNGCDDPSVLAAAMRPLVGLGPLLLLTDAPEGGPYPTGDEGKRLYREHIARWCQAPASMLALHSQFSDPDGCIRRVWNGGYETGQWLRLEDELRGHGRNVTVCNTFTASQQLAMAAAGWISGAGMVFLCSAGVISDGMKNGHFDAGESFLDAPGFRRLAELRAWLPRDVMRWRRVHGGSRDGSPRVFAVPGDDETRADHAIADDGRYVCVISGETRRDVRQVRDASVEDFPGLDDWYRIVKGRIQ